MDNITFESLCGEHILSGVELTSEITDGGWRGVKSCGVLLFTLDGVTYKLVEDPSDGWRSYCEDIQISKTEPKYRFNGVKVVCSMMEDDDFTHNDVIVMRDCKNGKTILRAGTENTGSYYPYCLFEWTPENMACNQGK